MTWSAPMTAVAGATFTAAQFNQFVRDNLNETAPAKATTPGSFFVTSASNQISERIPTSNTVSTSQTTTSTSYADLATTGPAVTVTTGTSAAVFFTCFLQNNTSGAQSNSSVDISGATTTAASDNESIRLNANAVSDFGRFAGVTFPTLTAGSNTFTMKYRVSGGTGTFANRVILVIPF